MKKHKNKNKAAKPVAKNIGIAPRDGMPVEVAEAMLFTPGTKLTTAMRKNCLAARETVFQSTLLPTDYVVKLRAKAAKATALQLVKWAKRTYVKRAKVTRDYYKLVTQKAQLDPMKLHDIARVNRTLQIIDIEAQRLDAQMASYRGEAERRLINNHIFTPVK